MLPGNKAAITKQWHLVSAPIDKNHCGLFLNTGMIQSTITFDKSFSILVVQLIATEPLKLPQGKTWLHSMFPLQV